MVWLMKFKRAWLPGITYKYEIVKLVSLEEHSSYLQDCIASVLAAIIIMLQRNFTNNRFPSFGISDFSRFLRYKGQFLPRNLQNKEKTASSDS